MIRRSALAIMAACGLIALAGPIAAALAATTLTDPATGVSVTVPEGYRIERLATDKFDFAARLMPDRPPTFPPLETTTSCVYALVKLKPPQVPGMSRADLNALIQTPTEIDYLRKSYEQRFKVTRLEPVMLGAVAALELEAEPVGSPESVSIATTFLTSIGRSTLSCFVAPPDWPMISADFRTLAQGISGP